MSAELRVLTSEPPGEGIVALLEELLERARSGDFSAVAFAYVDRDGASGSGWTHAYSFAALTGAVAILLARLTRRALDG